MLRRVRLSISRRNPRMTSRSLLSAMAARRSCRSGASQSAARCRCSPKCEHMNRRKHQDRIALAIVNDAAWRARAPGGTLIEATAGNTGMGLYLAARDAGGHRSCGGSRSWSEARRRPCRGRPAIQRRRRDSFRIPERGAETAASATKPALRGHAIALLFQVRANAIDRRARNRVGISKRVCAPIPLAVLSACSEKPACKRAARVVAVPAVRRQVAARRTRPDQPPECAAADARTRTAPVTTGARRARAQR